jgi:hypothetical protein
MPNTLAHIGIQWPLSRFLFGAAVDARWVLLGCVIPDLPWILQRILRVVAPGLDAYSVRLYAIGMASLSVCLVLTLAFALVARHGRRVGIVVSLGCLMHLLLDATQIKWGNGVHLLAPVSWDLTSFGWFWPESVPTLVMTGLGLVVGGWLLARAGRRGALFAPLRSRRVAVAVACFAVYVATPALLMDGPREADNHFLGTVTAVSQRSGRPIEFDRVRYHPGSPAEIETFARERLAVTGAIDGDAGTISVRGTFDSPTSIRVDDTHRHRPTLRNTASVIGLLLVAGVWLRGRFFA